MLQTGEILQINNEYRIRKQDKFNYTVERLNIVKDDKGDVTNEYWKPAEYPYCGTLEKACVRILEIQILSPKERADLEELKKHIKESKKEIIQAVKGL